MRKFLFRSCAVAVAVGACVLLVEGSAVGSAGCALMTASLLIGAGSRYRPRVPCTNGAVRGGAVQIERTINEGVRSLS